MIDSEFAVGQRVRIHPDCKLKYSSGEIIGISARYAFITVFIVLLDGPTSEGHTGVTVTQHHIQKETKEGTYRWL